jgi:septal ring factor EnvC (AmiA/AmiB activator)
MFWIPKWGIIKQAWPALVAVAVVVAAIIIGTVFAARGCSPSGGDDYLDDAQRAILEGVDARSKGNVERLKALEADLYDLRDQVDALDAEAKASAREREEMHDAIENAASIDDVDRILRAGIPGVSGRRR